MIAVSGFIVTWMVLAPGVSRMFTAFDEAVEDQGISSMSSHWNIIGGIAKMSFWVTAVIIVIGLILWLYMYASRVEYYTAGGIR